MNAQTPTSVDTNMTRCFMNTTIQWFADTGVTRMNFICDAHMFDVGILADQVDGLGQIVLNLSGAATRGFRYNEDNFEFHCAKQGVDVHLHVPYEAVLGFQVPFGENHMVALPIPNLERHMLQVAMQQAAREQIEAIRNDPEAMAALAGPLGGVGEELPDGAYAVHGVGDHEGDFPTVQELMKRKPLAERPKPTPVKEVPKPLLDFGNVGTITLPTGRTRPTGRPHLTLIQGGKA